MKINYPEVLFTATVRDLFSESDKRQNINFPHETCEKRSEIFLDYEIYPEACWDTASGFRTRINICLFLKL